MLPLKLVKTAKAEDAMRVKDSTGVDPGPSISVVKHMVDCRHVVVSG